MVIRRDSYGPEESKCHFYPQEGKGGSCQPHHNPWKGEGANNPLNHFETNEGQEGDWELSVCTYKGKNMPHQPNNLLCPVLLPGHSLLGNRMLARWSLM